MFLVGSGSYVVLSWVFLENIITTIASGPRVVFKSEYVHNVFLVSVLVSVSERPAQHLARTVFLLSSILGRVSPCPSVATCLLAVVRRNMKLLIRWVRSFCEASRYPVGVFGRGYSPLHHRDPGMWLWHTSLKILSARQFHYFRLPSDFPSGAFTCLSAAVRPDGGFSGKETSDVTLGRIMEGLQRVRNGSIVAQI